MQSKFNIHDAIVSTQKTYTYTQNLSLERVHAHCENNRTAAYYATANTLGVGFTSGAKSVWQQHDASKCVNQTVTMKPTNTNTHTVTCACILCALATKTLRYFTFAQRSHSLAAYGHHRYFHINDILNICSRKLPLHLTCRPRSIFSAERQALRFSSTATAIVCEELSGIRFSYNVGCALRKVSLRASRSWSSCQL